MFLRNWLSFFFNVDYLVILRLLFSNHLWQRWPRFSPLCRSTVFNKRSRKVSFHSKPRNRECDKCVWLPEKSFEFIFGVRRLDFCWPCFGQATYFVTKFIVMITQDCDRVIFYTVLHSLRGLPWLLKCTPVQPMPLDCWRAKWFNYWSRMPKLVYWLLDYLMSVYQGQGWLCQMMSLDSPLWWGKVIKALQSNNPLRERGLNMQTIQAEFVYQLLPSSAGVRLR